jgi:hypothetical protein
MRVPKASASGTPGFSGIPNALLRLNFIAVAMGNRAEASQKASLEGRSPLIPVLSLLANTIHGETLVSRRNQGLDLGHRALAEHLPFDVIDGNPIEERSLKFPQGRRRLPIGSL